MSRRNRWVVIGLTSAVVLAVVASSIALVVDRRQRAAREALGVFNEQFGQAFSEGLKELGSSALKADRLVRLEGDITTLTLTFTNPGLSLMKDVVIEGITLDKQEFVEQASLPSRVAELAPGASHRLFLHFEKVGWIDDTVAVGRGDVTWAAKSFDCKAKWVFQGGSRPDESRPGVEIKVADSPVTTSAMNLIRLEPEDARVLKARRDAGLKGR